MRSPDRRWWTTTWLKRPAGFFSVPLNIRCSRKCAMPDLPGGSSAAPTLYQIMWVTTGVRRSGMTTTSRPLASVKCATSGPVAACAAARGDGATTIARCGDQQRAQRRPDGSNRCDGSNHNHRSRRAKSNSPMPGRSHRLSSILRTLPCRIACLCSRQVVDTAWALPSWPESHRDGSATASDIRPAAAVRFVRGGSPVNIAVSSLSCS